MNYATNNGVRDPYDILGVPHDATHEQIKRAFRKLAMKWHPDRNRAPDAEARFKEINAAYEALIKKDNDPWGGMGDIFSSLFQKKGKSIVEEMFVTLDDIATGVERTMSYTKRTRNGAPEKCMACGGFGTITHNMGMFMASVVACTPCGGEGWLCTFVDTPQELKVVIPQGSDDDLVLCFPGAGHDPANPASQPGDLLISIIREPHPDFQRVGKLGLSCTVRVNLRELLLGMERSLVIPGRKRIKLRIPGPMRLHPRTLYGRGMMSMDGGRGDLVVTFEFHPPGHVDPQAAETFLLSTE